MKKIVFTTLAGLTLLNAQVIPGINSKGGAMTMPSGKLKMGIKYIQLKRDSMYNGTKEVTNLQNLDATAKIALLGLVYGVTDKFDVKVMMPYKSIEATAKLGPNAVAIDNSGLGDIVLMGRYVVLPMKDYGFQLSLGAGIKLPTGSTDSGFKTAPPFAINENTPMHYSFSAYEKKCEECITFDEVIIRMLRGEHMANPKIRKQILGN